MLESYAQIIPWAKGLQQTLCDMIMTYEPEHDFTRHDRQSQHSEHRVRILQGGQVFERAGVNFSAIYGQALPASASKRGDIQANCPFHAVGVSLVFHPRNPFVPTMHANIRFIHQDNGHWWFGGGMDLTPYYGFEQDARHWHQTLYDVCLPYGQGVYSKFKSYCDDYFYLPHRQETRGIGGIFYDDLNAWGFDQSYAFSRCVANAIEQAYMPIVKARYQMTYDDRHRHFQAFRRARYIEFNLLYDRGTLFGLEHGACPDAIFMSMPPGALWHYMGDETSTLIEDQRHLQEHFLGKRIWIADIEASV